MRRLSKVLTLVYPRPSASRVPASTPLGGLELDRVSDLEWPIQEDRDPSNEITQSVLRRKSENHRSYTKTRKQSCSKVAHRRNEVCKQQECKDVHGNVRQFPDEMDGRAILSS